LLRRASNLNQVLYFVLSFLFPILKPSSHSILCYYEMTLTSNRVFSTFVAAAFTHFFKQTSAFVFKKTNAFNYTYPNGNWTYVPCNFGYLGNLTCDELTGNAAVSCYRSYAVPSPGVCACNHHSGLSALSIPGCIWNSTDPDCISGPNACKYRDAWSYIHVVMHCVVIVLSAKAFFAHLFTLAHRSVRNVRLNHQLAIDVLLIVGNPSLIACSLAQISWPITGSRHFAEMLHSYCWGALGFAILGSLVALSLRFRSLMKSTNLPSFLQMRISRNEMIILGICGLLPSAIIPRLVAPGRAPLAALVTFALYLPFILLFLKECSSIMSATQSTNSRDSVVAKRVQSMMRSIGANAALLGVFASCPYALGDISARTRFVSIARALCINGVHFCALFILQAVRIYMNPAKSRRVRTVPSNQQVVGRILFFRRDDSDAEGE